MSKLSVFYHHLPLVREPERVVICTDTAREKLQSLRLILCREAYERLGQLLGCAGVHCELSGANAFFVRRDLVAGHFAGPFDAETHHGPPRYSLLHRTGHPAACLDRLPSP